MGAPPASLAGHGRANPAGIPYLSLGSTIRTAVAEVRPQPGEKVCVATFEVPYVRALDLRNPRRSVSPFVLESREHIIAVQAGLPLLERLGEELPKPVHPCAAAYEYAPSQYLCEFIKKQGYGGVLYRSSVSDGINLALFDSRCATARETRSYNIQRVTIDMDPDPWGTVAD